MNHIDFIEKHTSIKTNQFLQELIFFGADNFMNLWEECEIYLEQKDTSPPYWGFPWSGSLALGRFIYENPLIVKNRKILDFACGSGLAGISALKCGAETVSFNDIDELSVEIAMMNCELNNVKATGSFENIVGLEISEVELIFAGDIFYEKQESNEIINWLEKLSTTGKEIIIANPGRKYGPEINVEELARYNVETSTEIEENEIRETIIYKLIVNN